MPKPLINVCICTHRRGDLLAGLLERLQDLETGDLFDYSIMVVDNDSEQSGRQVVRHWQERGGRELAYFCEKQKNIALARNLLLEKAQGDFLAFIDDDEVPERQWLLHLFRTIQKERCFGVVGPVRPRYANQPAHWLLKLDFFSKQRPETGTVIHPEAGSTANLMLDATLVREAGLCFDPAFGRTGGEDKEFILRACLAGHAVVSCREAVVHETVPASRQRASYVLKRRLLQGMVHVRIIGKHYAPATCRRHLFRSLAASGLYLLITPVAACTGRARLLTTLERLSWHLGAVVEKLRFQPLRTRDDFN